MQMTEHVVKTTTLTGADNADLNKKQWDWQTSRKIRITKVWPDEHLERPVRPPKPGTKILAKDQFSRRIEYYEE
jgi:hypothetical protein